MTEDHETIIEGLSRQLLKAERQRDEARAELAHIKDLGKSRYTMQFIGTLTEEQVHEIIAREVELQEQRDIAQEVAEELLDELRFEYKSRGDKLDRTLPWIT